MAINLKRTIYWDGQPCWMVIWCFHVSMECSLAILKWDCPTWLPFRGRRLAYTSKDYFIGFMGLVTIHAGIFTSHMDPLGFSKKTTPQKEINMSTKKGTISNGNFIF